MTQNISGTRYSLRGGVAGRERLRLLAQVMRPTTLGLFEWIGLRPGMSCLDVGCGGGDVAFDLARRVGPDGRVVGIDMDETKLDLARREAAAQQLDNVEFLRKEVGADELEPGFDVVYSRFLLSHLPNASRSVATMCGAMRPQGTLVVEDIDMSGSFCHPHSPAFTRYVELYTRVVRQRGADPNIGTRLPELLLDAGCPRVQMNVVQPAGVDELVKWIAPITLQNIADSVLAEGLASRVEPEVVISELRDLAANDRTCMSLPRVVQAWSRVEQSTHTRSQG